MKERKGGEKDKEWERRTVIRGEGKQGRGAGQRGGEEDRNKERRSVRRREGQKGKEQIREESKKAKKRIGGQR